MAGTIGSKHFSYRKKRVQQFNSHLELFESLSPKALIILKCLGVGNNERDAAKAAQAAKSTVTYWKDKFLNMGLIRLVCRDVFQTFTFTPFGSKVITGSEETRTVVVLEDCAVKFGVIEWEKRRLDWVKLGEPRNWVKLGCFVSGVRVVRTSGSIIVHPGRLRGFEGGEFELSSLSGRIVEWVRRVLEDKFGMVLEADGAPLHKPIFRFYSEEAKEDVKFGTVISEGVGATDASPPERVPHEEYMGVERARARLLLPDSVSRLERKVDVLSDNVARLVEGMGRLADAVGRLVSVEPKVEAPVGNGVPSYVC